MCARDHLIQSVTGRTTGGFPLLQLWRPKALEHCDGKPTGVAGYDGWVARAKAERSRSIGRETKGRNRRGRSHPARGRGPPRVSTRGVSLRESCERDAVSLCSRRRNAHCKPTLAVALRVTFPCRFGRMLSSRTHPPRPLRFLDWGYGRARHPWRSRVRMRSSNPECHGPYDWRFPCYCNSGAPKR